MNIYEFMKNGFDKVIIRFAEFRDVKYLDIRTWYQNDKDEWKPTKKGIIIPLNKIEELKKGIDKACGECDNSVKEKT